MVPVKRLPLLTESRLRTYRRCAREEKLRYQDGLLSGRSAALEFGSLVHAALELWWLRDLSAVEESLADADADAYEIAKAWALMRGYDLRYAEDRDRYDVLAVEAEFRAPLVNPLTGAESRTWRLAGKIDAIVRERSTGSVLLVEHKTSSEDLTPGSAYWVRLRMDGQISCYYTGAQALGYEVAGCIYDVLGKPELRPSQVPLLDADGLKIVLDSNGERVQTQKGEWRQTADGKLGYVLQVRQETPEEYGERVFAAIASDPGRYYQRSTVVRLEQELRDWALDTWQLAAQMRDARRLGIAARNPDGCVRYGSQCGYLSLCSGEASADNYQRVDWVHPELTPHEAALTREESEDGDATEETT